MIFLIILLGAFLRLYELPANMVFHGELGDNYLAIKNFIAAGQIPLLGPPTSHPWFNFGPLFYWLTAPVLALFGYNPLAGAYFMALIQTALIAVNFYFVSKLFNLPAQAGKRVALISSFLIAISPLFLNLARESRFFSLTSLFFYPFYYYLVVGNLFLSGLAFGTMLNFHLTPIVFVPPLIIYLIRKGTKAKDYLKFSLGFVIPNLPFLIYNAGHGFEMLKNILLWVPYRILGFVGILPKNSPTGVTILANFYSLGGFVSASFMYRFALGAVFVAIVFGYLVWQIRKNWKTKAISPEFLLVLFFLFGYAGLFIHGSPPNHYYLPLYLLPIVFLALLLAKLKSKIAIGFILFVVMVFNLRFFFSKNWFFLPQDRVIDGETPYEIQISASRQIIADAAGQKFSLKRVGHGDEFAENYSQNYRYLLWWLGNEPTEGAKITYTIYEKEGENVYFSRSLNQE